MQSRTIALLVAMLAAGLGCSGRTHGSTPLPAAPSSGAPSPPAHPEHAPSAAVAAPDDASVALLRQALASHDWEDRLIAVEAIGAAGRPELAALLDPGALGDPEQDIRLAAVDALTKLCSRRLLTSVRDDNTERLSIRALAAGALLAPCHDPLANGDRP